VAAIIHLARWLAWQLSEPEHPGESAASITVFSSRNAT
jgi:hypothetical protein